MGTGKKTPWFFLVNMLLLLSYKACFLHWKRYPFGSTYWECSDFPADTWLPVQKLWINKVTGKTNQFVSWKNPNDPSPVLLDSGNLVLRNGLNSSSTYWESFDFPTDTLLPGQKLKINNFTEKMTALVSWKSTDDPSPGMYSVIIEDLVMNNTQFILQWNKSHTYWRIIGWNGETFTQFPDIKVINIYNYSSNENESYFTYIPSSSSKIAKVHLSPLGQLQNFIWLDNYSSWEEIWSRPRELSDVYAHCGAFALFRGNALENCACIAGFEPFSIEETRVHDWSKGCVRKHPLQCEDSRNGKQKIFRIINVTLPANSKAYPAVDHNGESCQAACSASCSCTAYAYNSTWCLIWERDLLNMKQLSDGSIDGQDIYVKVSYLESGDRNEPTARGEEDSNEDLLLFDFNTNEENNENLMGQGGKKDVELPLFSYASVSAATDNFCAVNKLGAGGFGPVYKGKLLNGQEVALKRLAKSSGRGLEEFRNEIKLIAKLQHRNLVRLLGCCIELDEIFLIYEYMENKSLDVFLFYFGMARMFGGNETQANTNRIVGTYGYMSPEYAMEGLFSIKSDVYSFGVLLLEIVSGKRNTCFYNNMSLNLLGLAWDLWTSDRGLELMDPTLEYPPSSFYH
ncbi:receptor kinase 3 [Quillaja saponaria]|uniref:Receptor kinase 3 n=1 Tax=Quillaja saponaria TaxID=32244 RepID=A0AAD7KRJ5_QUISA|nr:receptor kinase 3 [Quillaja saponaria]